MLRAAAKDGAAWQFGNGPSETVNVRYFFRRPQGRACETRHRPAKGDGRDFLVYFEGLAAGLSLASCDHLTSAIGDRLRAVPRT
jgi:hypothetical protein